MNIKKTFVACSWIGTEKEGCRCPTMYGKAYCEDHYDRMYLTVFPEMADYIIEQEITYLDLNNENRTLAKPF